MCIWLNLAQEKLMGESASIKVGSKTKARRKLISTRNMVMANTGKENVLSRRKTWPRSSASIAIPKGILHEIALSLRRYLAILKLVNFA